MKLYFSNKKPLIYRGLKKGKLFTSNNAPKLDKPTNINISPTSFSLKVGEQITLQATVVPSTTSQEVIWESSNEGFATVTKSGLVTAIAEGDLTITVISKLDETIKEVITLKVEATEIVEPEKSVDNTINEMPYISTYYIQPTLDINESAKQEFYVTDYNQKEYKEDDTSEIFTVNYWIDNTQYTLSNLKAGDHTLTIPPQTAEGDHMLVLQAIDSQGRRSHKLFNEFRVVDSSKVTENIYYMTEEDLITYGISIDNTNPVETTVGLNQLIAWAVEQKYTKLILLNGIYANDENNTVLLYLISDFTLDLNGSTFKMNPNGSDKAMQIRIKSCDNCHVINGIIEGDVDEHDYTGNTTGSEWVHGVEIAGGKYCSFKDLMVKNVTGYGTNTTFGDKGYGLRQLVGVGSWTLGDLINGELVDSNIRYSSVDFIPLVTWRIDTNTKTADFHLDGYIMVGAYLGYQGNATGNWVYKASFYDKNKNFIEEIEGYAYRRMYFSEEAEYVKLTLLSANTPSTDIQIFTFDTPLNCVFKNIYHQNVRCVGMSPCSFVNLLVEDCTLDNCGYAKAGCAFDAEDGWDMMQDLTFRKNVFINNPSNNFLTCAGHNFIIENNEQIGMYFWERTRNYVVRNNIITNTTNYRYQSMTRTGYVRIYGNTVKAGVIPSIRNEKGILVLRNETFEQAPQASSSFPEDNSLILIRDSIIEKPQDSVNGTIASMQFINSTFNNYVGNLSQYIQLAGCTFNNSSPRFHADTTKHINGCTFNNCTIGSIDGGGIDSIFKECVFKNTSFSFRNTKGSQLLLEDCQIELNGQHLFSIKISTPIVIRNCQITNNDTTKYIVYYTGSGATTDITLLDNMVTQEDGYLIGGVSIGSGSYYVRLKNNTIIGNSSILIPAYQGNEYVIITEEFEDI